MDAARRPDDPLPAELVGDLAVNYESFAVRAGAAVAGQLQRHHAHPAADAGVQPS